MGISMYAEFKILKDGGNGMYYPLDNKAVQGMTIGAYAFVVDGKSIPFDWDACSGNFEDGVFRFETGTGPFFNDYELSDCYDDDYKSLGLDRSKISAEYLASTTFIEEFHVNFDGQDGLEVSFGWHEDNAGSPDLKLELISIGLEDLESGNEYFVKPEVLKNYNLGLSKVQVFDQNNSLVSGSKSTLDNLIASASAKQVEVASNNSVEKEVQR